MKKQTEIISPKSLLNLAIQAYANSNSPGTLQLPTISLVIPVLNEEKNLPHVFQRIPHWLHEVVLVDGYSTDSTVDTACQIWPNHHVVTRERRKRSNNPNDANADRRQRGMTLRLVSQTKRGKGAALRDGFAAATGEIIVTMDADGSNDPAEITAFLGALLAGADYAKGSRFLQGGGTLDMPLYRKLGNFGLTQFVRFLFGGEFTDLCYGYNAFWARAVPVLSLDATGFEVETMMNVRALRRGLKIAEVPSFEYERIYGESHLQTIPDGWRVAKTILAEAFKQYIGERKSDSTSSILVATNDPAKLEKVQLP